MIPFVNRKLVVSAALLLLPASVLLVENISISAQVSLFPPGQLDPTRNIKTPQLFDQSHTELPEQYIWSDDSAGNGQQAKPGSNQRYFRASFPVSSVPKSATLYIAGVADAEIYLNGKLVDHVQQNPSLPLEMPVSETDLSGLLQEGKNELALKVSQGRGGARLVVKILPQPAEVGGPALLISSPDWKAVSEASSGWEKASFDDQQWPKVKASGGIESSIDFLQGNRDAGLYRWPGYLGISRFLAHVTLPAKSVLLPFAGRGAFGDLDALTTNSPAAAGHEFTVHLPSVNVPEEEIPSIVLDFGREVTGRIQLESLSSQPVHVTVQYGESLAEGLNKPYLGIDPLTLAPNVPTYGPKSAFRYAKVRFLGGGEKDLRFKSIALDDIYYPVTYRGSFKSSDPMLNRIWEVGAYTTHLCMQDDIWDAPKRDRQRWAGDLDVSGRVVNDVFADHFLMQETMDRLIGDVPVRSHVNGIPGYSAAWISEETEYYLHNGSQEYLEKLHQPLLQLLTFMEKDVDARNLYAESTHSWPFVDWSPELHGDTAEARRATQLEYYWAYRNAAFLLSQLGDKDKATHYEERAKLLKDAAQKYLLTPSKTFGDRWQTNAAAVFSGVADKSQYPPIWDNVLSTVDKPQFTALSMTPYYNYYIIAAMAETDHRPEALDWIRKYWGGMIQDGATSFWEGYYPTWPKGDQGDFHAILQADDVSGYFVSLAHGWSAGPTAWLMEQVLGIQPATAGFKTVTIRPDLVDLTWAKGSEPAPDGLLQVSIAKKDGVETTIDLPANVEATVLVPVSHKGQKVLVNGQAGEAASSNANMSNANMSEASMSEANMSEKDTRTAVVLRKPGHYVLRPE